ncbi:hypothetical protein FIBSPDRAFT_342377 [Athelia psychrophila]|uniref:Uncharacterized protein n=1 Tax=Athelia psychrophila TaxID=1759441 RepID=A0A166Q182_9AGAM|nr:hypothetical protein FIBSPDRAFT_342377 [Fibularhizoctonia sp. CBS 109695]
MDTDWCLSCGQHTTTDAPYCSVACLSHDRPVLASSPSRVSSLHTLSSAASSSRPQSIVFHHIIDAARPTTSSPAGIRAWAASIPHAATPLDSYTPASTAPSSRAPSPRPAPSTHNPLPRATMARPKLMQPRPIAPSLCISTPRPVAAMPLPSHARPIRSQTPLSSLRRASIAGRLPSSSGSSLTESLPATPSSGSPGPAAVPASLTRPAHLFAAVRSWVRPKGFDDDDFLAEDEQEHEGWWAHDGKAPAPVHHVPQDASAARRIPTRRR